MEQPDNSQKNYQDDSKGLIIKTPPDDFWIYSNPLLFLFKGGKKAEAGQWTLEIGKMLRGIGESVIGMGNLTDRLADGKKLYLEKQEVIVSEEKKSWMMTYLIDNAILRIYACLDKVSQMCRCYFEDRNNGGELYFLCRCGKSEMIMNEDNCNFGSLTGCLNSKANKGIRNKTIIDAINKLNSNKSICNLRKYRNAFTHQRHTIDKTMGLEAKVHCNQSDNGINKTSYSFGNEIPSAVWFMEEIVNANNAIVDFLEEVRLIIFPKDPGINIKSETNL
jgi:hypothetical protein